MTEIHYFTLKNPEFCLSLDGWSRKVYLAKAQYWGAKVFTDVHNWLNHNGITGYISFDAVTHRNAEQHIIGYESPSWAFEDELDALQFKIVFGAFFDYEIYDRE